MYAILININHSYSLVQLVVRLNNMQSTRERMTSLLEEMKEQAQQMKLEGIHPKTWETMFVNAHQEIDAGVQEMMRFIGTTSFRF